MRILKLMAEYQCCPLWEASPGEVGNVDPNLLPISTALRYQLLEWADVYESTLNWEDPAISGFSNIDAAAAFRALSIKLADQLREKLGPEFLVIIKINASVMVGRT